MEPILYKISKFTRDDPILLKLFSVAFSNSKNRLKGGRATKKIKGGFKGLVFTITIIISILIYVLFIKTEYMSKSESTEIKKTVHRLNTCNETQNINVGVRIGENEFPLISTSTATSIDDILERLSTNIKKHHKIPANSRVSTLSLSAMMNIQEDAETGKQVFNFELGPLNPDLMPSNEDSASKAIRDYESIEDFDYIMDHLYVLVFNTYVSGLDNFFEADPTTKITASFDLFNNRRLPSELNPNGYHMDTNFFRYIVLNFFKNITHTFPDIVPVFPKTNPDAPIHPNLIKLNQAIRKSTQNMLQQYPSIEAGRFDASGDSRVIAFGNMVHGSPSPVTTGKDMVPMAIDKNGAKIDSDYPPYVVTHNSVKRQIGDALLAENYFEKSTDDELLNKPFSGRSFLRIIIDILSDFTNPMYDFWKQKFTSMIDSLDIKEQPEHPMATGFIHGLAIPAKHIEKLLQVQLLARLTRASTIGSNGCNNVVVTPTSFAHAWRALTGNSSRFARGSKKKKTRKNKKYL